jgi:hypothetical protein
MKHGLFSALALVLASAAFPVLGQSISTSELVIGGVSIGQHERKVKRRLGEPRFRTDSGEGFTLAYAGLKVEVGVGDHGVYEVVSTNSKYCTPSKLCPGMSESHARRLYGEPVMAERETGSFLEYYPPGSTCWLQISAPKGIVKALRIACQP